MRAVYNNVDGEKNDSAFVGKPTFPIVVTPPRIQGSISPQCVGKSSAFSSK
jgi:hypothetical protein